MPKLPAALLALGVMLLPVWAAQAAAPEQSSLKNTVEAAMRNNTGLKSLQENRQAAEFTRKGAVGGFLPSLDLSGGIGMERYSDTTTRNWEHIPDAQKDTKFYKRSTYTATLSQPLWDGLAAWSRYSAASALHDSAESRLFDGAESLALNAIMAHVEMRRQEALVDLSQTNVENHRRILSTQLQRQRAGAVARSDLTQTQARVAKLAYERARLNYTRLVGRDPDRLTAPLAPEYKFGEVKELLDAALKNNPKVLAAEAELDAARARKKLDYSPFSPRISVDLGTGYDYWPASTETYTRDISLMLRGRWNLYNGHSDYYNLRADSARVRKANLDLRDLREQIAEEINASWKQWATAREQAAFYADAVSYNSQTSEMYLQQFNVGQRSLLDLLDAENELYSSSLLLVTAKMNDIASQYRLLALSGKLLDQLKVDRKTLLQTPKEE